MVSSAGVLAYIASIYRPIEAIGHTIGSLQDQFISLRIAFDFLDTDPEIKDAPHTASIADDICMLRAMHADSNQPAPASLQFHSGVTADVRPSMGLWISYGLGTEKQSLPSIITIHPEPDVRGYGSAFLPAAHQGTKVIIPQSDKQPAIDCLSAPSANSAVQRQAA